MMPWVKANMKHKMIYLFPFTVRVFTKIFISKQRFDCAEIKGKSNINKKLYETTYSNTIIRLIMAGTLATKDVNEI